MDKQEAINWCNNYLKHWPKNCKARAPTGWKWNIFTTPYKLPVYNLVSLNNETTISKKDTEVKS